MKYLITESKLEKVIFRYLDNQDFIQIKGGNRIYFANSEGDEYSQIRYDNDGVMKGYDLNLIDKIAETISIPLTVLGGAGSLADIEKVIDKHGVIGVAAGSLFVFKGPYKAVLINYPTQTEKNKIFKINKSGNTE
jgi:hypothetical protein